jgi:hypothetical protein
MKCTTVVDWLTRGVSIGALKDAIVTIAVEAESNDIGRIVVFETLLV